MYVCSSQSFLEIKWQRTSALCDVMVCCQAAAGKQTPKLVNNQRVKVKDYKEFHLVEDTVWSQ